jgi:hypothetical protein
MSVKTLCSVPIWKGNRIIDMEHVAGLKAAIKDVRHLDSGFRLLKYVEEDAEGRSVEQRYIVDGQHRLAVLRAYFEENLCVQDFMVTAIEAVVGSEIEAIAYFNRINNVKPIHYKEDPVLIVNRYIAGLQAATLAMQGGRRRVQLIKSTGTHRPYLSVDRLREELLKVVDRLPEVDEFVSGAVAANGRLLRDLELGLAAGGLKETKMAERCVELGFALAFDVRLRWISGA